MSLVFLHLFIKSRYEKESVQCHSHETFIEQVLLNVQKPTKINNIQLAPRLSLEQQFPKYLFAEFALILTMALEKH